MTNKDSLAKQLVTTLNEAPEHILEVSTSATALCENSQLRPITGSDTTSPSDLTGIGIQTAEWLDEHPDGRRVIILSDLNTLQMYHEKDTLFKFLHILSSKLQTENATLVCIQNITGDEEPNPFPSLFEIIIKTNQDGTYDISGREDDLPFTLE